MSRICDICGKGPVFGGHIARSGSAIKDGGVGLHITKRTKKVFYPNLQPVRMKKDGETIKLKVCTSCIKAGKTINV